jgi:hypothetical protein
MIKTGFISHKGHPPWFPNRAKKSCRMRPDTAQRVVELFKAQQLLPKSHMAFRANSKDWQIQVARNLPSGK